MKSAKEVDQAIEGSILAGVIASRNARTAIAKKYPQTPAPHEAKDDGAKVKEVLDAIKNFKWEPSKAMR